MHILGVLQKILNTTNKKVPILRSKISHGSRAVMGDSREQKFFPEISGNLGFLGIPGSFPVKFDVLLSLILFA